MLKLLFCLLCAVLLGIVMLLLRQEQLTLRHQAAELHARIERQQSRLWSQQLQIAAYTAPNAIAATVGDDLDLEPAARLAGEAGNWITPKPRPTGP